MCTCDVSSEECSPAAPSPVAAPSASLPDAHASTPATVAHDHLFYAHVARQAGQDSRYDDALVPQSVQTPESLFSSALNFLQCAPLLAHTAGGVPARARCRRVQSVGFLQSVLQAVVQ